MGAAAQGRVAVVGAGIVGLATTSELARAGAEVRCYDGRGAGTMQSRGLTRVFRLAHGDARLVRLAMRARELWRVWEDRSGRLLVGDEGLIVSGAEVAATWRAAMLDASAPVLDLTPTECEDLLPICHMPDAPAIFDPGGGATRVRRTVDFLRNEIGNRLITEDVVRVEDTAGGARVETATSSWECDELILAAGINTGTLAAPFGLDVPMVPGLQSRFTYEVRAEYRGRRLPCWFDETGMTGEGCRSYCQAVGSTGRYAIGVGWEGEEYGLEVGAEAVSRRSREVSEAYVRSVLPGLNPDAVDELRCTLPEFSFLDNGDGFLALRAGHITAFYGSNLFKFAPLLGMLLAQTATDGALREELRLFSPSSAEHAI